MQKPDHAKYVNAWMEQEAKDVPVTSLLGLFEAAWGALWVRAEGAVGEIVLKSIAELVRGASVKQYPFLSPLRLESVDVSCKALLESSPGLEKSELHNGLRFVLVEFITVIGDLTDQILTPGLYQELSRIAKGESRSPNKQESSPHESRVVIEEKEKEKEEETPMTAKEHRISTKEHHFTSKPHLISTGIRTLDEMLCGGLIEGSSTAIAGAPGSGKTILAQQIAFHQASQNNQVLFFSTLSEPGAKTLFYLKNFNYFDQKKIDKSVHFVDLGVLLRSKGLSQTLELIMERLKKINPAFVVVDSFKVFEDLTASSEEIRKFSYEFIINLMARKCTSLFLGEYAESEYQRSPVFSIIDGLITMSQRELSGEQQRFVQIVKMRGLAHNRDEHSFKITDDGIEIFAPRLTIKRGAPAEPDKKTAKHLETGIGKLDDLLGGGIPVGSSLLIAGVAGTGKTVLGLEFVYRGALAGEKGIVFSFEETDARLRAAAKGLGLDLEAQIKSRMVELVFIPQPDIQVENHLLMIEEKILAMGATRVVVDSLSVFVHKVKDEQLVRDKVFQLASIVQNAGAVGFFATDIPYGSNQMSRFGVEETVVDGVIILSSKEEGLERQRYVEVYKLRNTAHLKGRHTMTIEGGGIRIFPRYRPQELDHEMPPSPKIHQRLSTGVDGLDGLLGSGLLSGSVTLVSGSAGIGKSILGLQFLLEGASKREPGLLVTLEEGPKEILSNASALGLPLQKAVEAGLVEIVYLSPTHVRSTQFLAVLTDRIEKQKTRRLVLDSTTHIVVSGLPQDDVRELLYDMIVRFKNLGVTSLFTLESDSMYATDFSTKRGFSPLADNVIMLRYAAIDSKIQSAVRVIKTRGSAHDNGLYTFTIAKGGVHIGPSLHTTGQFGVGVKQPLAAGRARKH